VSTAVGIVIAVILALILIWLLSYAAGLARPRVPGAPITGAVAMERKVMLAMTMMVGIGLFLTGYSLVFESARQATARERQTEDSVSRGIQTYTTLCYPCHGVDGHGAVLPGNNPEKTIAANLNQPGNWISNLPGADEQKARYDYLWKTIHRGRNKMPAWGKEDGGPLLDEQIHELVLMIMTGDQQMSARIDTQPQPGIHELEKVDGTPWDIINEQLQEKFAEGAPTPIPPASLLEGQSGPAAAGLTVMNKYGCGACHTIQGAPGIAGKVGPELTHIGTEGATMKPGMDAKTYITESIRDPNAFVTPGFPPNVMPKLPLTDQELNDVVNYLVTLK